VGREAAALMAAKRPGEPQRREKQKKEKRGTREAKLAGPQASEKRTIYFCKKNSLWIGIAPSESREREQTQTCHTRSRLEEPLNNSPSTLPVPSVRPSETAWGRRPRVDARVGMMKDQQQTATAQQRSSDEEDEQGGLVDPTVGTQPSSAQATTPLLPHRRIPPASSRKT